MIQGPSQPPDLRIAPSLTAKRFSHLVALREAMQKSHELPLAPTVAIGDIHGNHRRLSQILGDKTVQQARHAVFLGDYFDRDASGVEVFQTLKYLPPEKYTFLLGNHEIYFLHAFAGDPEFFELWLANGGIRLFDAVVNTRDLRTAIQETIPTIDQPDMLKIFAALREERPELLDRYHQEMQHQPILRQMRQWLLDRGRLFAFDVSGILFVHAGLSPQQIPHLGIFDILLKFEHLWKATFLKETPAACQRAVTYSTAFEHLLETRDSEWLEYFESLDAPQITSQLARMGIRAIVYGHTPQWEMTHSLQRFFNIDMRMAKAYGELGGVLSIGTEGIKTHYFKSSSAHQMHESVFVTAKDFRALTEQDTATLITSFQHFFHIANDIPSAKIALSTTSFTVPLPLLGH